MIIFPSHIKFSILIILMNQKINKVFNIDWIKDKNLRTLEKKKNRDLNKVIVIRSLHRTNQHHRILLLLRL